MEHDLCLICGQPINLFSKDPFTDSICFACFQQQPLDWQEKVKAGKNDPVLVQYLLNLIIPGQSEQVLFEPVSVEPILTPTPSSAVPTEEPLLVIESVAELDSEKKSKKMGKKVKNGGTEDAIPAWAEDFYYQPGMGENEIRALINQRVFILNKMKYFTQVEKVEDNFQIVLLDMIRHQLEVIINQNELLLRTQKKNLSTDN